MLVQSVLMAGFALFAGTRFPLRPGALTLLYLLGNFAAAAAFTNDTPLLITVVMMSAAAGIVGDAIVARLHPSQERRWRTARSERWFRRRISRHTSSSRRFPAACGGTGTCCWER